ncbi:MAG: MraY family glycosyltransferase [Victivallales bacterium]|nr:MraY family glycosyltransferase [Victivallales bacterium]
MVWWQVYVVVLATAAILSLVLTPVCEKVALLTNFLDRPDDRHSGHARPIPVLGGVAMFLAWLMTIVGGVAAFLSLPSGGVGAEVAGYVHNLTRISGRLMFLCLGALLATLLGFIDDYFPLSAKVKFFGQVVVAVIAVWLGGMRVSLFIPWEPVTTVISVFWVLLIINAINFLDNMDGLAVGIAVICLALLTVVAVISRQYFIAALGAACVGSGLGFWFFNYQPASIFMGDSGSHFLGYTLAVLSAGVTYHMPEISHTRLTCLIPLFILAVPLFDTLAVVAIRLHYHRPVYVGDHNHISHRFVKMGMSKKHAVMTVHLLTLALGLGVLPLMWGDIFTVVVVMVQSLVFLSIITLLQFAGGYDCGKMGHPEMPGTTKQTGAGGKEP